MKNRLIPSIAIVLLFCGLLIVAAPAIVLAGEPANPVAAGDGSGSDKPPLKLEKAERNFGWGWFSKSGYQSFIEPRVAFVKRMAKYSESVEYSWRPMVLKNMPHKERIDQLRFSFNRYYYSGRDRKVFYGAGLGGNAILFNRELKDWGNANGLSLKDGINGLGRLFAGFKFSEFKFNNKVYPLVLRADAFISPDFKFGGNVGEAGDRIKLTEFQIGIAFSIE